MMGMNRALCQHRYGVPENVISLEEVPYPSIASDEILIQTLLAPINPADINILEGRYGDQPRLPAILGNEGVGKITQIGSSVQNLAVGDHVITPKVRGTWCEYRKCLASDAVKVPVAVPLEVACMLAVNPLSALLLLEEFETLKKGDWLIQNAGNSGLGRAVIDIARARGLRTLNIVRTEEQVAELNGFGGDWNLTFDSLQSGQHRSEVREKGFRLALNGVGGENSRLLTRALVPGGTMVTYGAMGKEPVIIDNGLLIFKNISVRGFWRSHWVESSNYQEMHAVFSELLRLAQDGSFFVPIQKTFPFSEAKEALALAQQSHRAGKVLLTP